MTEAKRYTYFEVSAIFNGSNGDETKAMYAALEKLGPRGEIAVNLFRATKTSGRAKDYRGRGYRDAAYDTKQWSIGNLCRLLRDNEDLDFEWGWGLDPKATGFEHVLYVVLPAGQVSFHSDRRLDGPDSPVEWDRMPKEGPRRVCQFVADVFAGAAEAES